MKREDKQNDGYYEKEREIREVKEEIVKEEMRRRSEEQMYEIEEKRYERDE